MRYSVQRRNEKTVEVEADGFDAMQLGAGGLFSAGPTGVHYVFWRKPSAQYQPRTNVAAFSDVTAVMEIAAPDSASPVTELPEREPAAVS